jgi:DHA3 family macrolide efflux protein-like MFS transporter
MEAAPSKSNRSITRGMRTFFVIWSGQLVSTIGSGLTGFALGVWIYQETGSVTLFSLNLLAVAVPNLVVSPFAGALVDRWDRRWVMIMSDTGAGLATMSIAILYMTDNLAVWNIILATAFNSAFSTFQWPAYSAVTTLLVPKQQLGRAGGMVQIGEAISQLLAPAAAGALFVTTGLGGVIAIDFATYLFAVLTLLFVRVPSPERSEAGKEGQGSIWKEALYGWTYISTRAGLLGLLIVFAATNLLSGMIWPLITPMLLDMTSADTLGYLVSIVGVGMLIGTLVMSAWGGPKRRIHGVLGFLIISGFFISMLGVSPLIAVIAIAGFCIMFTMPIINGSSQAIWQSKVDPDVQGRVFSVRRMIAWSTTPLAYIVAGPLVDRVFGPMLMDGGVLADSVGRVIGVGPGRGTGFLFILIGAVTIVVSALGYLNPYVRNVEDDLPDVVVPEESPTEIPPAMGEESAPEATTSQVD